MLKKVLLVIQLLLMLSYGEAQINHQPRINLDPSMKPFYHGVESGDPMADRVMIWSRVTPDTGTIGNIDVFWQIATDTGFTNVVNYGSLVATEENHYCVKADVCGLQPSTYYYYMFNSQGKNSIIGRTKTAPAAGADVDSVRFAVVSCASWEHGYFNAYQSISEKNDVDAVVHLGDYIYEYASGDFSGSVSGRTYDPPTECITEVGYELRYSQYKLDKQLQRLHQLFPFITVWDDHETANDSWREGAQNHDPATEGSFDVRKHNSTSTYFKWMPIRKPDPADTIRIFRKLRYGKLLDLVMLDTRLYDRDEQDLAARDDSTRHIMGPVERAWFLQQLDDTTTQWKIIGNQVMFAPLQVFGQPVNADQWDGYNYERTLIEDHIMNNNIKDIVILTGDIHTSWCNDVPGPNYNSSTGAGSVCVEFVGTSVTSLSSPLPVGTSIIQALNPNVKYVNINNKGYYILNIMKTRTQADYNYVSTVTSLGSTNITGPSYFVNNNERHLRNTQPPVVAPRVTAPNPPLDAKQSINVYKITDHYLTTNENTQVGTNVIPSLQMCPMVTLAPAVLPAHGTVVSLNGQDVTYVPVSNYNGYDTVAYALCTNDTVPVCDTIYLYITINSVNTLDTITINLERDSAYTACLHFDDLVSAPTTVNNTAPHHGTVVVTDTCFTYQPDAAYAGVDWVTFTTCDTSGNCDTIVYQLRIDHPVTASTIEVTLNKNTNVTPCLTFDDLVCAPGSVTITQLPQHGTYTRLSDTCTKYAPYYNYVGDDTIQFVGCDTCGLHNCDTITVIFHTVQPNAINEPSDLVVFGMFPNPVNDKLIIQYYLYNKGNVSFTVYDLNGKVISIDTYNHADTGLLYAQLNTSQLAKGQYIVEVSVNGDTYRKQIIKQ